MNINDTVLIKYLTKEVRDLEKSLAVAVEALEYYESCDGVGEQDNGVMAREALKELQEGK